MNSRTIDVVTDWETVPTPDGYEGLHQLADTEFSGAVSAGMTWAFFLNGRVVGVFEGDIDAFEDAELTAYRAADSSLPLLFAMQERDGETQARYYTNDTSLSDADRTLSEGGFTGYIELSENVLSGDYYVVYHGGKSMSAAFVGSSERLITGEEAFETAADEVGIYEVIDVDVDIVDIPELETPDTETGTDASAGAAAEQSTDPEGEADAPADTAVYDEASPENEQADEEETVDDETPDAADEAESPNPEHATDAEPDRGQAPNEPQEAHSDDHESVDDEAADPAAEAEAAETAATEAAPPAAATSESSGDDAEADRSDAVGADPAAATEATVSAADETAATDETATTDATDDESAADVFSDEERWREAQTIPSLDPDRSTDDGTADGDDGRTDRQSARERVAQMQRQRTARREAGKRSARNAGPSPDQEPDEPNTGGERPEVTRLKQRLARTQERIEALQSERDELQSEHEELQAELESLRTERSEHRDRIAELEAERDELQAEVERLEAELTEVAGSADPDTAGESMSPERALSGTNLFVRYDRKGEATLEHAHDGEASREDVRSNLRLEHHTTFETDGLAVDGQPYDEFLRASTEYSFADWVVTDLLYEIGETGNRTGLGGVFDAIPEIDRIELYGTVTTAVEDGSEERDFDVIFRDQMGNPLFVADLNDSRNATTEAMVGSLVGNTGTVATEADSLAAGFYVTESFYEPGALETVAEETGGGLLTRSKKLSYVKLSRKRGYHLCLVEARDGEFHLNVPDL
jgi:hypothetical protein